MRKLSIKTGEKISAEAEATLQSTHQFKNELIERTQRAAELSTDYNRLCAELTTLQTENLRLVQEVLPSDAVLHQELQSIQEDFEQLQQTLSSQIEEKKTAQQARQDLEFKLKDLDLSALKLTKKLEAEHELYRRVLRIELVPIDVPVEPKKADFSDTKSELNDQYRVNFLDLNQSAILIKNSATNWRIEAPGHSVEGNMYNWADLTRMLYNTRSHLKSLILNQNS